MFVSTVNKYTTGGCHYQTRANTNANSNGAIFLHVTYHNCGPSSKRLQSQFDCLISNLPYDTPLSSITNSHGRTINPRLFVLFHQTKDLGDLLSSRNQQLVSVNPCSCWIMLTSYIFTLLAILYRLKIQWYKRLNRTTQHVSSPHLDATNTPST